jgi:hypothetical protein
MNRASPLGREITVRERVRNSEGTVLRSESTYLRDHSVRSSHIAREIIATERARACERVH